MFKQKFDAITTAIYDAHQRMCVYSEFNQPIKNRLVLYIILLMTISQMAITIYLPSMPSMKAAFHTDNIHIQYSLTLYLLGYGFSQFFYGPLSDVFGRRLMILIGMSVFVFASAMCMFATGITFFLFARTLQGIGIGCGDTMGRAILCDCFVNKQFVKAASYIGMASTVTPLVAPIMGGYFQHFMGWRASFVFLFLYGFINAVIMLFYLPETKLKSLIPAASLKSVLNTYWFVLRNRIFLGFFIPGLVSFVGEMLYNMMSPFIIQEKLGLRPIEFGWLAIFIVLGLFSGTLISNRLSAYISNYRMVFAGISLLSIAGIIMLIPSLFNHEHTSVSSIIIPMIIFMIGVGITYPNTNMGALSPFTKIAGTAGALQGGLQMLCGGLVGILLGKIPAESELLLAFALSIISITGLIFFVLLLKTKQVGESLLINE